MKDFNIAKYLKEHNLGPHGILGRYVDLQPLKEEKVPVKQGGIYPSKEAAQKIADVCTTAGMTGVEIREVGKNKFKVFADPGQEPTNEGDYGNNEPVYDEPYEGPEDPIDGLGGKLNRDMDVSMNEMDGDDEEYDDDENVENAWMKDVDGTEEYKIGDWTCGYDESGELVWSFRDIPFDEIAVYATPDMGGDFTYISVDVDGITKMKKTINKGVFANFQDYANSVKPVLDELEGQYIEPGTYDEAFDYEEDEFDGEESENEKHDRMMSLIDNATFSQLAKIKKIVDAARNRGLADSAIFKMLSTNSVTRDSIEALIDDGFEIQDIVDFFATDASLL